MKKILMIMVCIFAVTQIYAKAGFYSKKNPFQTGSAAPQKNKSK